MALLKVIVPTALVAALAPAASAVNFTAETHVLLRFIDVTSGIAVHGSATTKEERNPDGNATATADAQTRHITEDRYWMDASVTGSAQNGGSSNALAQARWNFSARNSNYVIRYIKVRLTGTQDSSVRNYGNAAEAEAFSYVFTAGDGITSLDSHGLSDMSFDTYTGSLTRTFTIALEPRSENYFSFTIRSSGSVQAAAVPEPSSIAALGLGGLALLRRRRK